MSKEKTPTQIRNENRRQLEQLFYEVCEHNDTYSKELFEFGLSELRKTDPAFVERWLYIYQQEVPNTKRRKAK